jgi:hypothetical protein
MVSLYVTNAVPDHSQKTLFTRIADAASAIGLLIKSCQKINATGENP